MAKNTKSKPATSTASSWWSERSKITAKKAESTTSKPKDKKKIKTKKAEKAETGETYICEICGCEMICASDSSGQIVCCEEPMCIVI